MVCVNDGLTAGGGVDPRKRTSPQFNTTGKKTLTPDWDVSFEMASVFVNARHCFLVDILVFSTRALIHSMVIWSSISSIRSYLRAL